MSHMITISLGGKSYRLDVPEADEAKVRDLAHHVDGLMQDMRNADATMDRDQMWALVALQLAAQGHEAMTKLDEQGQSVVQLHRAVAMRLENLLPQT